MINRANSMHGPLQPKLTLKDAKRIARGTVGSAVARAQKIYNTRVFALVTMSNHVQLVVQTRGKNLASFMRYVKARIAETINLLTGKRGPLWSRRYEIGGQTNRDF
jgi:REP element-mobilizing transposase RayT